MDGAHDRDIPESQAADGASRHRANGGVGDGGDDTVIARYDIGPVFAGYRLDQFLGRMAPKLSRTRIQKLITTRVKLSWDVVPKASTPVRAGEHVMVFDPRAVEAPIHFQPRVLLETRDVLAINKPPGIVVHPTNNHRVNTIITLLRSQRDEPGLTLAHRLDADTSGVLILGRHRWAARKLQTSFERDLVEKHYLALAFGSVDPEMKSIDMPLGAYSRDGTVFRQTPESERAKNCVTHIDSVEAIGNWASLLHVRLETGRRHQIRAHLAQRGHPLVGDKLYNLDDKQYRDYLQKPGLDDGSRKKLVADRGMLHAHRVTLPDPRDHKHRLEIESPMPDDMKKLIEDSLNR